MFFLSNDYGKIEVTEKAKEDGYEIDYWPGKSGESIRRYAP